MNRCHFIGNLTRDPETRTVGADGTTVCSFGIGVNGRPYKDKAGNSTRDVMFIDCEAWASGGDLIAQYFKKGDPIVISNAELRLDTWEDKTSGERRQKHKLRVLDFEFLPGGKKNSEQGAAKADDADKPAANKKTGGGKKKASTPAPAPEPGPDDAGVPVSGEGDGQEIPF